MIWGLEFRRVLFRSIGDSLQDWRDANEEHRLNGAESDYYRALPVPYRSHNANLDSVAELLQVRGVTPEIYRGTAGAPGLVDLLAVPATGQVNINTASPAVLKALGPPAAPAGGVLQAPHLTPYTDA